MAGWRVSQAICLFGFFCLLVALILHDAVHAVAHVLGSKEGVPECEEGLCKVCLDAPVLVVDVVVSSVVASN